MASVPDLIKSTSIEQFKNAVREAARNSETSDEKMLTMLAAADHFVAAASALLEAGYRASLHVDEYENLRAAAQGLLEGEDDDDDDDEDEEVSALLEQQGLQK